MNDELRAIGPGRYAITVTTPWGEVPAELIVATQRGWPERLESRDPRWAAYSCGPIVLAVRLKGNQVSPTTGPKAASAVPPTMTVPSHPMRPGAIRLPRSPVPAEWN